MVQQVSKLSFVPKDPISATPHLPAESFSTFLKNQFAARNDNKSSGDRSLTKPLSFNETEALLDTKSSLSIRDKLEISFKSLVGSTAPLGEPCTQFADKDLIEKNWLLNSIRRAPDRKGNPTLNFEDFQSFKKVYKNAVAQYGEFGGIEHPDGSKLTFDEPAGFFALSDGSGDIILYEDKHEDLDVKSTEVSVKDFAEELAKIMGGPTGKVSMDQFIDHMIKKRDLPDFDIPYMKYKSS